MVVEVVEIRVDHLVNRMLVPGAVERVIVLQSEFDSVEVLQTVLKSCVGGAKRVICGVDIAWPIQDFSRRPGPYEWLDFRTSVG